MKKTFMNLVMRKHAIRFFLTSKGLVRSKYGIINHLLVVTLVSFTLLFLAKQTYADEKMSPDVLYTVFRKARLALSEKGPAAMIRPYSRQMLEVALSEAFRIGKYPSTDYDRVKDKLWEIFERIGRISAIYSKSIVASNDGNIALRLEALLQHCDAPVMVTISFVNEAGEWKIDHFNWDYRPASLKWYSASLKPIEKFPAYVGVDHSIAQRDSDKILGIPRQESKCIHSQY